MQKFTLAAIAALMAAAPAFAAPAQADDWLPEAQRINREIVRQNSSYSTASWHKTAAKTIPFSSKPANLTYSLPTATANAPTSTLS